MGTAARPEREQPDLHRGRPLQPGAQVTSDLYDWSWSPHRIWIALLDATGPDARRGLACAQSAALALAALRNARRARAAQARLADQAVAEHDGGTSAVSALIAEIDPERGHARVIAAGAPLLILGQLGKRPWVVEHLSDQPPLGLGEQERYTCDDVAIEPGQWMLVASDGVITAPDRAGQAFGLERLRTLLDAGGPAIDAPRRIIEAVRTHSGPHLADDASTILFAMA